MPPPLIVELGLTRACNLHCIFCTERAITNDEKGNLPDERWLQLVHEAADMGVQEINIAGGGEPFFRPERMLALMSAIKSRDVRGSTTTNGTLITDDAARRIVEMGWDHMLFSIDAPDARTHDELRNQQGVFERAMDALKRLDHWKSKLGKSLPEIWFSTVLTNRNHTRIDELIGLAREYGVRGINFIPLLHHTEESEKYRMGERHIQQFLEHLQEAIPLAQQYAISTNLGHLTDSSLVRDPLRSDVVILSDVSERINEKQEGQWQEERQRAIVEQSSLYWRNVPCYHPWLHLVVHATGHVQPCIHEHPHSYLGDRSLGEVWYHDPHLRELREMMGRQELHPMCSTCCAPQIGRNRDIRKALEMEDM